MRARWGALAAMLCAARVAAQPPVDTVRVDTAWVGMARIDTVGTDTVRIDTVRTDTVRADTARTRAPVFRADTTAVDSTALSDTARREGRRAAGRADTFGRGTLAFFGGVPIGFFGPLVPFAFREPVALVPPAVGAGLVALAVAGRAEPPDELATQAAARGPVYARVYRDAYTERLRARRKRATLIGGIAGAGTGVALLVVVIRVLVANLD